MNNLVGGSLLNNTTLVIIAVVIIVILIFGVGFLTRSRPKKLNTARFTEKWKEVQQLCKSKTTWPLAVINADKLLDDALKQRKYKGKTMGERMVSAQRTLSDNDSVWYGHKLRNKLVHEDLKKLSRRDVESALRGFRQALKDLRAL